MCARVFAFLIGLAVAPGICLAAPSYWCTFTEPFISVASADDGVRVDWADLTDGRVRQVSVQQSGAGVTMRGRLSDGGDFNLTIAKGSGSDGMSEFDFPYEGVLSGAFSVTGGCVKMAQGTVLRQVVGVAKNDVLNVRGKPNAAAKVLTTVYPDGFVWLRTVSLQNGWARVSAVFYPKGEQGDVKAVDGWVRAKFLAKPR